MYIFLVFRVSFRVYTVYFWGGGVGFRVSFVGGKDGEKPNNQPKKRLFLGVLGGNKRNIRGHHVRDEFGESAHRGRGG